MHMINAVVQTAHLVLYSGLVFLFFFGVGFSAFHGC